MNFSIGLSGLQVAQRAIELIGTNISNVSTEGYHRQNALIEPFETDRASGVPIGGARVKGYQRAIDTLLEKQILTQNPQLSQLSQEIMTLRGVESSFGSLDTEGLGSELTKFFGALRELSGNPTSQSLREQAVWAADSLASTFRHIGGTLNDLDRQALTGAQSVIAEVNALAVEIAELNGEIQTVSLAGGNPNLMADKRDQAVLDLAELVEVDTVVRDDGTGVVDILIWGTPLVVTDHAVEMEVGALSDGKLGLSVKDASSHDSDIRGGKLGAARPECRNLTQEARLRGARAAGLAIRAKAVEAYADLIDDMTAMRTKGATYEEIAERLNRQGHTTRRQKPWTATAAWRVLKRAA